MLKEYDDIKEEVVNNVLKEHDAIKEELKNLTTSTVHQRFYFIYQTILSYCLKCRQKRGSKNPRVTKDK